MSHISVALMAQYLNVRQRKSGIIIIQTVHILQHDSADTGSLPVEDFVKHSPSYFQIIQPGRSTVTPPYQWTVGTAAWTVHHNTNLNRLGHSPPASLAGLRVGLSFRLIAYNSHPERFYKLPEKQIYMEFTVHSMSFMRSSSQEFSRCFFAVLLYRIFH
jgi:hypothetical protein